MVRSTTATTKRRTRKDIAAVAHLVSGYDVTIGLEPDRDRAARLVSHGWAVDTEARTDPVSLTGNGRLIGAVAATLIERDEFDWAVDIFGVGGFVDITTDAPSPDAAVDLFGAVFSVANMCDEARHRADTQDVEPDHDGLFAPNVDAVDARRMTIDVVFEKESTADAFVDLWNGSIGSTVAVPSASNPHRVTVADVRAD